MDIKKREILFLFGENKKNILFLVSFFVFFTSGLA